MYIYGKNVVEEALKRKDKINKIYLYKNFNDQNILKLIDTNIIYLDKYELDKKVKGNHQGIIADVPDFEYNEIDEILKDDALILILDHIEDPHNLGAIIRTAEAAGVTGIIIPKNRTVEVNSTVIKTSCGSILNTKIVRVSNITQIIEQLKKEGFWIVGTDMEGTSYEKVDMKGKCAIVIGNEGKGLANIVKRSCDFIAKIPMYGKVNSLNASVATGVIIYEAIRQRNGL